MKGARRDFVTGTAAGQALAAAWGAGLAALVIASPAAAQQLTRGPYLQSVTETSIYVVFDQDVAGQPEVRFGLDGNLTQTAAVAAAATHHEVRLEGLEPNTRYDYAVYEGELLLSSLLSLHTAPNTRTAFSFLAFGDTRSDPDAHGMVIQQMATEPDMRFVLHTGDLVSAGEFETQWVQFFQIEQPLIGSVPLYAVLGNHEVEAGAADLFFDYLVLPDQSPAPEAFYSFDYGNVHVIGLDSHINSDDYFACLERDISYDLCFNEQQLSWLLQDLDAASASDAIDHTIVMIHIGPFTSKENRYGNPQILELLDLFLEKGVSLVVSGHDHYYERGEADNGIPYMILGGGGAPIYDISDPSIDPHTVAYNAPIYHYAVIDVDGATMTVTVKDVNGQAIDSLTLQSQSPVADPPGSEPSAGDEQSGGCGCHIAGAERRSVSWPWLLAAALLVSRRRCSSLRRKRQRG